MIYTPIWKDIKFSTDTSPLEYQIVKERQVLHTGYATNFPGSNGVELNLNNVIEEYMKPDFERDLNEVDDGIIINFDAYSEFNVVNTSNNSIMETYGVLYDWSYDNGWSGETNHLMSQPINGHLDPRMRLMCSLFNKEVTQINCDVEMPFDAYLYVTKDGGVNWTANSYSCVSSPYSVSASSAYVVETNADWITVVNKTHNSFALSVAKNSESLDDRIATVTVRLIYQQLSTSFTVTQPTNINWIDFQTFYPYGIYEVTAATGWGATLLSTTTLTNEPSRLIPKYPEYNTTIYRVYFDGAITSIPEGAFNGTDSTSKVCHIVLPETVQSIGSNAFINAEIYEIDCYAATPPTITSQSLYDVNRNGKLHYPAESDYSSWLTIDEYYLGFYGWSGVADL